MKKFIIINKKNTVDLNNDDLFDVRILLILPQNEDPYSDSENSEDIFEELLRRNKLN